MNFRTPNIGIGFTERDKLTALAIVNIFETSRALGGYGEVAVLDDGAGVSYGFMQFTHRSGALCDVVEEYLATDAAVAREALREALPWLRLRGTAARNRVATDDRFRRALRAAGVTREMKAAQQTVAERRYMAPALRICEDCGFTEPLSLAVVYDSVVHGSFERIAARVSAKGERAWITEYVRKRHIWLTAIVRLRTTSYRTRFFLGQIAIGNWALRLPLTVHGVRLADAGMLAAAPAEPAEETFDASPAGGNANAATNVLAAAASGFDRIDAAVTTVASRTDRAKSLWATVVGSLSQAAWAVFASLAGLPREVWIVAAVLAAAMVLLYLYRQLVLGTIRETAAAGNRNQ